MITLLSFVIGQKKYPVSYPLKDMAAYLVLAAVLFVLLSVPVSGFWWRLAFHTLVVLAFVAFIVKRDMPLRAIPFINRFFK